MASNPEQVRHNPAKGRYELEVADGMAFVTYIRRGETLIITHTETPSALQGRGLASRLIAGMLEDVRQKGLHIVPRCSFVTAYVQRHPEVRDLVASDAP